MCMLYTYVDKLAIWAMPANAAKIKCLIADESCIYYNVDFKKITFPTVSRSDFKIPYWLIESIVFKIFIYKNSLIIFLRIPSLFEEIECNIPR